MAQNLSLSLNGALEILAHEGVVTSRYKDSAGVWTVGVGHTISAGLPDPRTFTNALSIEFILNIFFNDIKKFEKRVRKAFKQKLSQEQFDAAVSFDFNTGGIDRALWVKSFNTGNFEVAKQQFMNWSKPKAIIARRKAERTLFFESQYSKNDFATLYPAAKNGKVLWHKATKINMRQILNTYSGLQPKSDKTNTESNRVMEITSEKKDKLSTLKSDMKGNKMSLLTMLIPFAAEYGTKFLQKKFEIGGESANLITNAIKEEVAKRTSTEPSEENLLLHSDVTLDVMLEMEKIEAKTHKAYLEFLEKDKLSDIGFIKYWRPFIGWAFGVECAALVLTLIYMLVSGKPIESFEAITSYLLSILTLQTGVVGYYVHSRTKEKIRRY